MFVKIFLFVLLLGICGCASTEGNCAMEIISNHVEGGGGNVDGDKSLSSDLLHREDRVIRQFQ